MFCNPENKSMFSRRKKWKRQRGRDWCKDFNIHSYLVGARKKE